MAYKAGLESLFLKGLWKNHKNYVSIASVPAKIWTTNLSNISQKHYSFWRWAQSEMTECICSCRIVMSVETLSTLVLLLDLNHCCWLSLFKFCWFYSIYKYVVNLHKLLVGKHFLCDCDYYDLVSLSSLPLFCMTPPPPKLCCTLQSKLAKMVMLPIWKCPVQISGGNTDYVFMAFWILPVRCLVNTIKFGHDHFHAYSS